MLDSLGVDLSVRWIASKDNSQADALSRGSPFDELVLKPRAFADLDARFGPHTVDGSGPSGTRCDGRPDFFARKRTALQSLPNVL